MALCDVMHYTRVVYQHTLALFNVITGKQVRLGKDTGGWFDGTNNNSSMHLAMQVTRRKAIHSMCSLRSSLDMSSLERWSNLDQVGTQCNMSYLITRGSNNSQHALLRMPPPQYHG